MKKPLTERVPDEVHLLDAHLLSPLFDRLYHLLLRFFRIRTELRTRRTAKAWKIRIVLGIDRNYYTP